MYKYSMLIDDSIYNDLFINHAEARIFIEDNENDGYMVTVLSCKEVGISDILVDADFGYSYCIEMIAEMTLPNAHSFEYWAQQEAELKRLGIIV